MISIINVLAASPRFPQSSRSALEEVQTLSRLHLVECPRSLGVSHPGALQSASCVTHTVTQPRMMDRERSVCPPIAATCSALGAPTTMSTRRGSIERAYALRGAAEPLPGALSSCIPAGSLNQQLASSQSWLGCANKARQMERLRRHLGSPGGCT